MQIDYAISMSPLGNILLATTQKGICMIAFSKNKQELEVALKNRFSKAEFNENSQLCLPLIDKVLLSLKAKTNSSELALDIYGTEFQKTVWKQLQKIEYGKTVSYTQVAQAIGKPKAVRAVASACGANPLALIIPCHRVIGKSGNLCGYRWGLDSKQLIIKLETKSD